MSLQSDAPIVLVATRTTCEDFHQNVNQKEIIEVGLCLFEPSSGRKYEPVSVFVKTAKKKISKHCQAITGISQKDSDGGVSLDIAFEFFEDVYDTKKYTWGSYGHFTKEALESGAKAKNVKLPFGLNYINIQKEYSATLNYHAECGMKTALSMLGLKNISNLSCEDEVLNLGIIYNEILKKGRK